MKQELKKEFKINEPYGREKIREFKCGDIVLISGRILTARDAVHKYLYEGGKSPISLKDQILYHCGPVILKDEKGEYRVNAAGPTTSTREEPYQAKIIEEHGIVGMIGKGGMGIKTLEACKKFGAVYFHAVGGAAQVLATKVQKVLNVYLMEFGSPEAMWELVVQDFPVIVTMDSEGVSLHEKIKESSEQKFQEILKTLR